MRHRIRIQPYISPDLHRKLRAHSLAEALTDSAVIEIALSEHLERDAIDEGLVVRRLDGLAHAVEHLQHDMDVLSQAVGIFVRYSFNAPLPAPTSESGRQAESYYQLFLARISRHLAAGARLSGDVQRARKENSKVATESGK